MRRWDPLNERQLATLRRVEEGSEPVTSRESGLATTVYALRGRGLVRTPRSHGAWTAEITEAGRFYLERGYHPDRPDPQHHRRRSGVAPQSPHRGREVTVDDLLSRLAAGPVRVDSPSEEERAAWRRVVHAARQQRRVPDGLHLRHRGRDRGELVIELVEGEHPAHRAQRERAPLVAVPQDLVETHPVVRSLRGDPGLLDVSAASFERALRLVQALAAEAERHGHTVSVHRAGGPGFWVQVGQRTYQVTMSEEWTLVDELPSPEELAERRTYAWQRVRPHQARRPTGRLTIELPEDWQHRKRRRRWRDTQRWRLDDKLGEILAEIEHRAAVDEQRHAAEAEAKARRQREWQSAMGKARERFIEDHRAAALGKQISAWARAGEIRRYCDAVEQRAVSQRETAEAEDLRAWIAWARGYADKIDPVLNWSQLWPTDPEIRPEDLRPYLGAWSPYGPEARY